MAFDKFKMALTLFVASLLVFYYLQHFEMHAKAYDKLLRAPTASELERRVLRDKEEWPTWYNRSNSSPFFLFSFFPSV